MSNFPTAGADANEREYWSVWQNGENGKWLGEWPHARPNLGTKIKINTCLLKKKVVGYDAKKGRLFVE